MFMDNNSNIGYKEDAFLSTFILDEKLLPDEFLGMKQTVLATHEVMNTNLFSIFQTSTTKKIVLFF